MIKKEFIVPLYYWNVTFLEIESQEDAGELSAWFDRFDYTEEGKNFINALKGGIKDVGLTKVELMDNTALMVIFPSTTDIMRNNTISHEKRHLEDFILENAGIHDKEAAGYLSGYLGEIIK